MTGLFKAVKRFNYYPVILTRFGCRGADGFKLVGYAVHPDGRPPEKSTRSTVLTTQKE